MNCRPCFTLHHTAADTLVDGALMGLTGEFFSLSFSLSGPGFAFSSLASPALFCLLFTSPSLLYHFAHRTSSPILSSYIFLPPSFFPSLQSSLLRYFSVPLSHVLSFLPSIINAPLPLFCLPLPPVVSPSCV